jgi:hypothetical protein
MAKQSYEAFLDGRQSRRMKNEDAAIARGDRQYDAAINMIGELCRDGKTVYYVSPAGGRYREGTRVELVDFLIRNKWV